MGEAQRIEEATAWIDQYVISNEDWHDADEDKKTRLLNASGRTLKNKFKGNTIPDNAISEFAAYLAIVYNDTNKMQQQGIASFSVTGVGSFTFKENNVKSAVGQSLKDMIPDSVVELIEEVNENLHISGRNVGWLV